MTQTLPDLPTNQAHKKRFAPLTRHVHSSQSQTSQVYSPTDGQLLGEVPISSPLDVERAFHFARLAQQRWGQEAVYRRVQVLKRFHDLVLENRDEALDLVQLETGKARKDALEEVLDICVNARHYAKEAGRLLKPRRVRGALPGLVGVKAYHRPKGVVGVIAPWNYPLTLAASDALAAIVAGNAVVLKPDSKTPFTALWVANMFERAGLPDGVLSVVVGSGSGLGPTIVGQSDFVMFTGSTNVGRVIAAGCGERLIGCSLELGGKNAMVILADADINKAVDITIRGSFANSGQLCVSTERIYVAEPIWDDFVLALRERVANMRLSAGVGWGADMGSLIDAGQVDTVRAHLDDARAKGATVVAGGSARPEVGPYVFEPTVLTGVTDEMEAYRKETFGPLISLYSFTTDAEAIRLANDSEYGLNASVVTSDLKRGQAVAAQIRAGTVNVNEGYAAAWGSTSAPMGGFADSGLGRRHGEDGILKYTESQTVATMRALSFGPQFGMSDEKWGDLLTKSVGLMKKAGFK